MSAQAVQIFPLQSPENTWRDEIFKFLNNKLDEIVFQENDMDKIEDITGAIFQNKSEILGQLTLGLVKKNHSDLINQEYCNCPQCNKQLKAWNKKVKRSIESLGGCFDLYRPYFYCKRCQTGYYPLDEALGLSSLPKQYDIQDVEAWLSSELPFETAAEAFTRCTSDPLSADHLFQTTNRIANHFDILDVCPSKSEIEARIAELATGKFRRPVMMLAIDGAHVPTRPEPSPWKGKRGKGG